jgi:tetratricopeptide (TPR) repeat protein
MPTRSAAFDGLLLGRHLLERRAPDAILAATQAFRDAIRADSAYAPAYAGLSAAHLLGVIYGFPGGTDPYEATALASAFAERAIALDPQLADGHLARADALLVGLASHAAVTGALRAARRLRPGSAEVFMSAAHALEHVGQWDAALQQAQRALALDPLSTGLRHSAITVALGARRYDLALEEARRAMALTAEDPIAAVFLGYALLLKGDAAACAKLPLRPWLGTKAICLHEVGQAAEAKAAGDTLGAQLDGGRYVSLHQFADMAAYRAWQGDAAGALRWLEKGTRVSPMIHYWHLDSGLFDRVRQDSAFTAGLSRLEDSVRVRVQEARGRLGDRQE